jgi:hypothetical protein
MAVFTEADRLQVPTPFGRFTESGYPNYPVVMSRRLPRTNPRMVLGSRHYRPTPDFARLAVVPASIGVADPERRRSRQDTVNGVRRARSRAVRTVRNGNRRSLQETPYSRGGQAPAPRRVFSLAPDACTAQRRWTAGENGRIAGTVSTGSTRSRRRAFGGDD